MSCYKICWVAVSIEGSPGSKLREVDSPVYRGQRLLVHRQLTDPKTSPTLRSVSLYNKNFFYLFNDLEFEIHEKNNNAASTRTFTFRTLLDHMFSRVGGFSPPVKIRTWKST